MSTDKNKLIKVGLYICITCVSLVYYYVRDTNEAETLGNTFQNSIFGIEGVSTKLSFHDEQSDGIFIKIEALGLPENAISYKPVLLAFVCSNPHLKRKLISGKSIVLDMSAPDREQGNYVNMNINQGRCSYDT